MSSNPDTILQEAEGTMTKSMDHLKRELKGVRTGRAAPSILEMVKVEYYGSSTDLKSLASISVAESTQLVVKPFDTGAISDIKKGIEAAGLGLNPISDGKQLRVNIPALSGDRRKQLSAHCKKVGEDTKVALRNARRDGNKHADALKNNPKANIPEDELETLKKELQDLLKKYETEVDTLIAAKQKDIETV